MHGGTEGLNQNFLRALSVITEPETVPSGRKFPWRTAPLAGCTPAPECKGCPGASSRRPQLAHIMGSTYYGSVNITLSLDEEVVKQVRKIAIERDTTLTGLVRAYLEELAVEHARSGRKRRELEALERSFELLKVNVGKRTWKREDLHERR